MASKEEQVRKAIVCDRNENPDLSVRKLTKKLGFPTSTVNNVLKSFDTRLTTARKAGSGIKIVLQEPPEGREGEANIAEETRSFGTCCD